MVGVVLAQTSQLRSKTASFLKSLKKGITIAKQNCLIYVAPRGLHSQKSPLVRAGTHLLEVNGNGKKRKASS